MTLTQRRGVKMSLTNKLSYDGESCHKCGRYNFKTVVIRSAETYKGHVFYIPLEINTCTTCTGIHVTPEQRAACEAKTIEAYNKLQRRTR